MSLLSRVLGRPVKAVRKQPGLTQAELAERAGVSRQTIIRLEHGSSSSITVDKLFAILDALGLELTVNPQSNSGVRWKDSGEEVDLEEGLLFLPPEHEALRQHGKRYGDYAPLFDEIEHEYQADESLFDGTVDYKAIAADWDGAA